MFIPHGEGLCTLLSRMHEMCCYYNVLSKSHIYEAATWLQSVSQISKEVQSMKSLTYTEQQQHLSFKSLELHHLMPLENSTQELGVFIQMLISGFFD